MATHQLIEFQMQSSQWALAPHSTQSSSCLWRASCDGGHPPVAPDFLPPLLPALAERRRVGKRNIPITFGYWFKFGCFLYTCLNLAAETYVSFDEVLEFLLVARPEKFSQISPLPGGVHWPLPDPRLKSSQQRECLFRYHDNYYTTCVHFVLSRRAQRMRNYSAFHARTC